MVKYHKDIVKEASHFYAKAKYEGHLDQVTNEIQAILDGIQNTSTFRQLMHLEHLALLIRNYGKRKQDVIILILLANMACKFRMYLRKQKC